MRVTTYTALITVVHNDNRPPHRDFIAERIKHILGDKAVGVDALMGDHLYSSCVEGDPATQLKATHAKHRRDWRD